MSRKKTRMSARIESPPVEYTVIAPGNDTTMTTEVQSIEPVQYTIAVTPQPKPLTMAEIIGRYVPPECPYCHNLKLPNRRTTFVNGTVTTNTQTEIIIERSIKCPSCRNSRMDYERIPHSLLQQDSTATE